jgi:hypothetical protein
MCSGPEQFARRWAFLAGIMPCPSAKLNPIREIESMPALRKEEMMWLALGLAWFFLASPLLIVLSMRLGLWPQMSFWIVLVCFLVWVLLTGVGLSLYSLRAAREMGIGGLVVVAVWIGPAILLARGIMSAFRSIRR